MNWVTAGMVFVVIWWPVFFCVLPIGIRPAEEDDIGASAGAPANPRLGFRVLLTTVVTAVIFAGVYAIIRSDWLSFRS